MRAPRLGGYLIVGWGLIGCAGSTDATHAAVAAPVVAAQHPHPTGPHADHSRCDATRPGRTETEYDTNADGVPDVRKVYLTVGEGTDIHSVLVCREADLNHDGIKDLFRFYNDEGRTLREEEDHDFDGRIDVISYFENGEVVRQELDTNHDGKVDMRIYFRDHRPYRAERELQHDSSPDFHPDYWEFYDARGHVVRIGWDYDHDGRADRWDRVDRLSPQRSALTVPPPDAPVAPGSSTVAAPGTATPQAVAPGGTPPATATAVTPPPATPPPAAHP